MEVLKVEASEHFGRGSSIEGHRIMLLEDDTFRVGTGKFFQVDDASDPAMYCALLNLSIRTRISLILEGM